MKIAIGSDHAGFEAKESLLVEIRHLGYEFDDVGTGSADSVDYPDFARAVAKAVAVGRAERGVLICGTGIGMSMAANKVKGIRAALCHDEFTAEMSRRHNNANVLCMGARILANAAMARILDAWLAAPFEGGKHERRLGIIAAIEQA